MMKKTIAVANILLQNDASEILLLQRSPRLNQAYHWGLPGGIVDENESELRAATRELSEETGFTQHQIAVNGVSRFLVQTTEEDLRISILRACLLIEGDPVVLDPNEHIAYMWVQEPEIYASSNLLSGLPTIISYALESRAKFTDLTLANNHSVTRL